MEASPSLILKLGGSVITVRDRAQTLKRQHCVSLINKIQSLVSVDPDKRIVVVLGGGSYGHIPVAANHLCDERLAVSLRQYSKLECSLYRLFIDFLSIANQQGLELHPFPVNSILTTDNHAITDSYLSAIRLCFEQGGIPTLTGGPAYDETHKRIIFGSDRVPELIASGLPVLGCIYVCDSTGIYKNRSGEIYSSIVPAERKQVYASFYDSEKPDVTGGMRGKFDATMRLAAMGVPSVICSMDSFIQADWKSIEEQQIQGTHIRPQAKQAVPGYLESVC